MPASASPVAKAHSCQPAMTTMREPSWRSHFRGLPNHTRVQKERAMTADEITPKTRQTLTSRLTTETRVVLTRSELASTRRCETCANGAPPRPRSPGKRRILIRGTGRRQKSRDQFRTSKAPETIVFRRSQLKGAPPNEGAVQKQTSALGSTWRPLWPRG